jgi:hypothetical protein
MPTRTFGGTTFDAPESLADGSAMVRITNADGSSIRVPAEDVLRWVYGAYIIPQRLAKMETKDWREGLLG